MVRSTHALNIRPEGQRVNPRKRVSRKKVSGIGFQPVISSGVPYRLEAYATNGITGWKPMPRGYIIARSRVGLGSRGPRGDQRLELRLRGTVVDCRGCDRHAFLHRRRFADQP